MAKLKIGAYKKYFMHTSHHIGLDTHDYGLLHLPIEENMDKADVQHEDKDWPAYKKYFMHGTSHHIGV